MDAILTFLATPTFRWALGLVLGAIGKSKDTVVTKGLPIMLFIGNALVSLAAAIAGVSQAHADPLGHVLAAISLSSLAGLVLNPVLDGLVTTALTVGTHSGAKNTWGWIKAGAKFFVPKGDPRALPNSS